MATYAVVWRADEGPVCAGQLRVAGSGLRLDGTDRTGVVVTRRIGAPQLRSVAIGRAARDRIDGRSSVVVEQATGERLRIASASGFGLLHEIADELVRLQESAGDG